MSRSFPCKIIAGAMIAFTATSGFTGCKGSGTYQGHHGGWVTTTTTEWPGPGWVRVGTEQPGDIPIWGKQNG